MTVSLYLCTVSFIYSAIPPITVLLIWKISRIGDSLISLIYCERLQVLTATSIISEMPYIRYLRPFWRETRWNLLNVDTVCGYASQIYTRGFFARTDSSPIRDDGLVISEIIVIRKFTVRPSRSVCDRLLFPRECASLLHLASLVPLIFNAKYIRNYVRTRWVLGKKIRLQIRQMEKQYAASDAFAYIRWLRVRVMVATQKWGCGKEHTVE